MILMFFARSSFGIAKYTSSTFPASSAIPFTSSIVSVGSPIIKYSFTLVQPPANSIAVDFMIFSSVIFLFITSRSLCVPASGAKVIPVLRTFCTFSISSREKLSILKDGSDSPIFCFSVISSSPSVKSRSPLKSLVDNDDSDISS